MLLFAAIAQAEEKRPTKIWNRTGPLGETPKHVTDAYPLVRSAEQRRLGQVRAYDRRVRGQGTRPQQMGRRAGGWKGRQPALFSEKNVTVSDGKLHLTMRKEKLPPEAEKQGYKDYTSAAFHSKGRTAYGYFEVKAKPMNSAGSSSFWFHEEASPTGERKSTCSRSAARPRVSSGSTT